MSKEIRLWRDASCEVRSLEDGRKVVEGYALKYDTYSEELWFGARETLARGCLEETDLTDVVALFNHDDSLPLARTTVRDGAGTLHLQLDEVGLRFTFSPVETSYADDLIKLVESGVVHQCSFAFSLAEDGDAWRETEDGLVRIVRKIARLWDISLVTFPAYADTNCDVAQRSLDAFRGRREKECQQEVRERSVGAELELLGLKIRV